MNWDCLETIEKKSTIVTENKGSVLQQSVNATVPHSTAAVRQHNRASVLAASRLFLFVFLAYASECSEQTANHLAKD